MNITATLNTLIDRISPAGPVPRSEQHLWEQAHTVWELSALTARWLHGELGGLPWYYGCQDVDTDLVPDLVNRLARLNRSGYLTTSSQAGYVQELDPTGRPRVEQYAAVTGFCGPGRANRLLMLPTRFVLRLWSTNQDVTDAYPLVKPIGKIRRRREYRWGATAVTFVDGKPVTDFGPQTAADIRSMIGGSCPESSVDELCGSVQFTVYDPQPGSNDLWPALDALLNA